MRIFVLFAFLCIIAALAVHATEGSDDHGSLPSPPEDGGDEAFEHSGTRMGSDDDLNELHTDADSRLRRYGGRTIFANGTGISRLPNCTANHTVGFERCRNMTRMMFRRSLRDLRDAVGLVSMSEKLGVIRNFWCGKGINSVRLAALCVRPCHRRGQTPGMSDLGGFSNMTNFCSSGIAPEVQSGYGSGMIGFNNEVDMEAIVGMFNCSTWSPPGVAPPLQPRVLPTCDQMVAQGADASLATFEASTVPAIGSNSASAFAASLCLIALSMMSSLLI